MSLFTRGSVSAFRSASRDSLELVITGKSSVDQQAECLGALDLRADLALDFMAVAWLIEYFLRCPLGQARMIEVTGEGKVIYKTGGNRLGRFPDTEPKGFNLNPVGRTYFAGISTVIAFEGPVPRGPFGVGRTAYTR